MDKNYKQKAKDFFRKEGFYVALFLCLCVVTTVAAVSYKKARNAQAERELNKNKNEVSLNVDDKNITSDMQNAERVKNDTPVSNKTEKKDIETKAVASTNEVKFSKPVEGLLVRGYTYPKPEKIDEGCLLSIKGIDIAAKVGTQVKAAAEGVVENIGNNGPQEGIIVEIKHPNGIKTIYSNLDSKVSVKKGDKVTAGTVIGTVGKSAKIFKETSGEHLNLRVIGTDGEDMDPTKCFSYKEK